MVHVTSSSVNHLRIDAAAMVPQVWTLEDDVWVRHLEESYPTPGWKPAMVYDPVRDVIVRFGGQGADGYCLSETWEYDGNTWVLRTDVSSPPGRRSHAMAYDPDSQTILMFGGSTKDPGEEYVLFNDFWEYDGGSWVQLDPRDPIPAPRELASMAYDESRGRMVLAFGWNLDFGSLSDTWEWNGRKWSQPHGPPPSIPRNGAGVAYDPIREKLYAFGGEGSGETAFWNGSYWEPVSVSGSPPARYYAPTVFDASRGEILIHGGQRQNANTLGDTWVFNGSRWLEIPQAIHVPPARDIFGFTFDEGAERAVTQGGFNGGTLVHYYETWEWNGDAWSETATMSDPGRRENHAMVYDALQGVSVMFGGYDPDLNDDVDQTWEYDSTRREWTELLTAVRPGERANHSMAYRSSDGAVVVFGGEDASSGYRLDDTWVLLDDTWQELDPSTRPSARYTPAMAFDEARNRIVLYGGRWSNATVHSDTWVLENDEWVELLVGGPGRRGDAGMVYDRERQVSVLAGGAEIEDTSQATWEFDGNAWSPVSTVYSPSMHRSSAGAAWDPVRKVMVFSMGSPIHYNSSYNDTWVYGWDEDDDLAVDAYDNCPAVANAGQEDGDEDGAGNVCDCAPTDPGSHHAPVDVSGLAVDKDPEARVFWPDQSAALGSDVVYDLVTGLVSDLVADGGFNAATCLEPGTSVPEHADGRSPPGGDGYYYLVRSRNACGTGTYGTGREGLDGSSPCP
jgi:hypothetical protein